MRILIDAHMVGAQETGNETYVLNLLEGLSRRPDIQCGAVVFPENSYEGLKKLPVDILELPSSSNWQRLLSGLGSLAKKWQADILHTTYIGPFHSPVPLAVTVHDVSFRRFPEFFSPRDRLLFATLFPYSLHRARAIITISKFSKQELEYFYPSIKNKVTVTYLAIGDHFRPISPLLAKEKNKNIYSIQGPFILAVGNLQPRKNISRLIQAFAPLSQKSPEIKLVVVGKAQWKASEIGQEVARLGLENRVIFTRYVSEEDLLNLYNGAEAFIYPSLYEGFGLPVLEAMQCGTPVVASKATSIPEVAGDAALLIDPFEIDSISNALTQVLTSQSLRTELSQKGLIQAGKFSQDRFAENTIQVYRHLVESRRKSP